MIALESRLINSGLFTPSTAKERKSRQKKLKKCPGNSFMRALWT